MIIITILIISHILVFITGFILAAILAAGKRADESYGNGTYGNEKR